MIAFTLSSGETLQFSDSTLLVFIDDTGHEELSDKKFPIFGFGGCIVRVSDYPGIVKAWETVAKTFPSDMNPLHASAIKPSEITQGQKDELKTFFTKNLFGRFAAVITDKSVLKTKFELFNVMAGLTYKRITAIARSFEFDSVVMIFEESKRTRIKVADYFSRYDFGEIGSNIPITRLYATKKNAEAGLIIADFVAHTAGTSVMSRLKGRVKRSIERKDFELVFASVGYKYASFMEINDVYDDT